MRFLRENYENGQPDCLQHSDNCQTDFVNNLWLFQSGGTFENGEDLVTGTVE